MRQPYAAVICEQCFLMIFGHLCGDLCGVYIYIYIYMVSLMLVRAQDAIIVIKLTFSNDFDTSESGYNQIGSTDEV